MGFFDEDPTCGQIPFQGQKPGGEKAGAARKPGEIFAGEETQSRCFTAFKEVILSTQE